MLYDGHTKQKKAIKSFIVMVVLSPIYVYVLIALAGLVQLIGDMLFTFMNDWPAIIKWPLFFILGTIGGFIYLFLLLMAFACCFGALMESSELRNSISTPQSSPLERFALFTATCLASTEIVIIIVVYHKFIGPILEKIHLYPFS